jgi:uncharacterized membrane protein
MLYRLLALSSIAETDRRQNNNRCFGNTKVHNATELCQEIYGSIGGQVATPPPPAAPLNLGIETIPGYEAVVQTLPTCNSLYAPPASASPPSPPPFPNWNFYDPITQGMGSVDPVVDACRNIHTFGNFDQQSAFGIPDILHPFSWKPAQPPWDWVGGWFYYAVANDKMQGLATLENNPINALKLHNAYRLATSATMLILTGVCCGYWIGFGGTPFIAFLFIRCGEVQSRLTGNYQTLLAPRFGWTAGFAAATTLGVWAYAYILDPWLPAARAYNIDPSCAEWHSSAIGSVFVTSEYGLGSWEFIVGYLFPFMPLYAFIYGVFCRTWSAPKEEWQGQAAIVERIPQLETLLILFQLGSILCFSWMAIEDGDLWFDRTIRKRPDSHAAAKADADVLIEDLNAAILVAILAGVACSVTRQRWTISKLGYQIHIFWFASIVVAIGLPFAIFNIEIFTNTARTPRNVAVALYWVFTGFSLAIAVKHWLTLRKVPGGTINDKTASNSNNTVKRATPASIFARLRRKNTKAAAADAASNPFARPYIANTIASADADVVSSLPLLGLRLDPEAPRSADLR